MRYFDYYLLHDVNRHPDEARKLDFYEWIQDKKQQGLIKAMEFSFHDDTYFWIEI